VVKQNEAESCDVYFDGSCPLCRREIDFYRRREGAEAINWVDVSAADYAGGDGAPDPQLAMKRFHVKRPDGALVSGGAAFAELWVAIPALRPFGILFRHPPFSWAIDFSYRLFLPLRPWLQKFATRKG
jgi:predicted DCC family thiol-disulfide oxidoreductase YuxK